MTRRRRSQMTPVDVDLDTSSDDDDMDSQMVESSDSESDDNTDKTEDSVNLEEPSVIPDEAQSDAESTERDEPAPDDSESATDSSSDAPMPDVSRDGDESSDSSNDGDAAVDVDEADSGDDMTDGERSVRDIGYRIDVDMVSFWAYPSQLLRVFGGEDGSCNLSPNPGRPLDGNPVPELLFFLNSKPYIGVTQTDTTKETIVEELNKVGIRCMINKNPKTHAIVATNKTVDGEVLLGVLRDAGVKTLHYFDFAQKAPLSRYLDKFNDDVTMDLARRAFQNNLPHMVPTTSRRGKNSTIRVAFDLGISDFDMPKSDFAPVVLGDNDDESSSEKANAFVPLYSLSSAFFDMCKEGQFQSLTMEPRKDDVEVFPMLLQQRPASVKRPGKWGSIRIKPNTRSFEYKYYGVREIRVYPAGLLHHTKAVRSLGFWSGYVKTHKTMKSNIKKFTKIAEALLEMDPTKLQPARIEVRFVARTGGSSNHLSRKQFLQNAVHYLHKLWFDLVEHGMVRRLCIPVSIYKDRLRMFLHRIGKDFKTHNNSDKPREVERQIFAALVNMVGLCDGKTLQLYAKKSLTVWNSGTRFFWQGKKSSAAAVRAGHPNGLKVETDLDQFLHDSNGREADPLPNSWYCLRRRYLGKNLVHNDADNPPDEDGWRYPRLPEQRRPLVPDGDEDDEPAAAAPEIEPEEDEPATPTEDDTDDDDDDDETSEEETDEEDDDDDERAQNSNDQPQRPRRRLVKARNLSRERREKRLQRLREETRRKREADEDERLRLAFVPVNSLSRRRRAAEPGTERQAEAGPSLGEVLQRRKPAVHVDPRPVRRELRLQDMAEQRRAHPKSEAKELEVKEDPFEDPWENGDWIEMVWPEDGDPDSEEMKASLDAVYRRRHEAEAMRAARQTGLQPGKTPAEKKREAEMARRRKVAGGGPAELHKERPRPRASLPENRINAPRPIAKGGVRRLIAQRQAGLKAKARAEVEKMLSPQNQDGLFQRPVDLAKYSMDLLAELHLFAFIRETQSRHGETLFYLVRSDRTGRASHLNAGGRYLSRGKALLKMHDTLLAKYGTTVAALQNWERTYRRKEKRPSAAKGPSSAAGK